MKPAFESIAAVALDAARAALPERVQVSAATPLPRGADPFVGAERPLLLAATRWTFVAPGGVLLGGSPASMAAVLGFEIPARSPAVAPEDRDPNAPAPPKWSDLLTEAARETATTVTQAIAAAIAPVADLPPDCAATQVAALDSDAAVRAEVGPLPDGLVLMLHVDDHEVRLVVVVPGVMVARLGNPAAAGEAEPAAPEAEQRDETAHASARLRSQLDHALSAVPLELAIGVGHASVPLAHVLELADGEVLELQEAADAPVELVSGDTAVAYGDLEVSDHGTLVLHVTEIPGRAAVAMPSLVEPSPLGTLPATDLGPPEPAPSAPQSVAVAVADADSDRADEPAAAGQADRGTAEPPDDDADGGDAE